MKFIYYLVTFVASAFVVGYVGYMACTHKDLNKIFKANNCANCKSCQ